jgi:hypothetical protein
MAFPEKTNYTPGERSKPVHHGSTLAPEGTIDFPEKGGYQPGERQRPVLHGSNLAPEGKIDFPQKAAYEPAQRPKPARLDTQLQQEGAMEFRTTKEEFTGVMGERAKLERQHTSLEVAKGAKFEGTSSLREEFRAVARGERAEVVRKSDNLALQGTMEMATVQQTEFHARAAGERVQVQKHEENLKVHEGMVVYETSSGVYTGQVSL